MTRFSCSAASTGLTAVPSQECAFCFMGVMPHCLRYGFIAFPKAEPVSPVNDMLIMILHFITVLGSIIFVFDCKFHTADTFRKRVVNPKNTGMERITNDAIDKWHEDINEAQCHLSRKNHKDSHRDEDDADDDIQQSENLTGLVYRNMCDAPFPRRRWWAQCGILCGSPWSNSYERLAMCRARGRIVGVFFTAICAFFHACHGAAWSRCR